MLLKNNTGVTSRLGLTVKVDPRNPQAFIYSNPSDNDIIGIVGQEVPKFAMCNIITSGTAKVMVAERVVQGATIRGAKTSDNISRGFCKTAKSTDTPYFQIGTAIESGKGVIKCSLNLSYSGSSSTPSSVSWGDITGKPTTISGYAITDALAVAFETVSKNLKSYPYVLTYGVDGVSTITYNLGGGLSVVKTFNYTLSVLTSIVLSGDTPSGIELTKTLSYTGIDLTGVVYS